MGLETDMEFCQLIAGTNVTMMDELSHTLEECHKLGVHTQAQALDYLSSKVSLFDSTGNFLSSLHNTNVCCGLDFICLFAPPVFVAFSCFFFHIQTLLGANHSQVKTSRSAHNRSFKQTRADDAREALASLILSHIPGNSLSALFFVVVDLVDQTFLSPCQVIDSVLPLSHSHQV
jgi:hypothetical protein